MVYGVPGCYFCILAIGQTLADIAEQVPDFNAHEFGRKGGQGILGVTELSCPSMAVVSLQVQEANRRLDQSMVKQAQGILSRAAAKHTTVAPLTHNLLKRGNRPESGRPGPTTASRLARRLPAKGPPRLGSDCPGPGKSAKDIGQFGYLQLPIPEFIPAQPQPPPGDCSPAPGQFSWISVGSSAGSSAGSGGCKRSPRCTPRRSRPYSELSSAPKMRIKPLM